MPARLRCVVLDRDGTLIRHVPYLKAPSDVQLLPTVREGLNALRKEGCLLFLHTNQSGAGRGYFAIEDAVACNTEMFAQIGLGEQLFEKVCIAPEAPGDEQIYRKPSPRFGLEIIRDYGVRAEEVCYIGDSPSDLLAAKNIGCMGVGVNTGLEDLNALIREDEAIRDCPVFPAFADAVAFILRAGE